MNKLILVSSLFLASFINAYASSACHTPEAVPFLEVMSSRDDFSQIPDSGIPANIIDTVVVCMIPGVDFLSSRIEINNLTHHRSDGNLTLQDFCQKGFYTTTSTPIGVIRVSRMDCPGVIQKDSIPALRLTVLAKYAVIGQSDYRQVYFDWLEKAFMRPTRIGYKGSPIDVMLIESGTRGLKSLRLDRCTGDFATCLDSPAGRIEKLIDLPASVLQRADPIKLVR